MKQAKGERMKRRGVEAGDVEAGGVEIRDVEAGNMEAGGGGWDWGNH